MDNFGHYSDTNRSPPIVVVKSEHPNVGNSAGENGVIMPSMTISSESKTPYTDATQVGQMHFHYINGLGNPKMTTKDPKV